jgi:Na+/H+ antiporter NhaD/arsenite permease-like protein
LSFKLTPKLIHTTNLFTWEPVKEVGILFLGIFLTMVPALDYLRLHGENLGIHQPWQYFLITGGLSSLLDNAPTYLAFCVIGAGNEPISSLPANHPLVLAAICCGAVFMGANTYIVMDLISLPRLWLKRKESGCPTSLDTVFMP